MRNENTSSYMICEKPPWWETAPHSRTHHTKLRKLHMGSPWSNDLSSSPYLPSPINAAIRHGEEGMGDSNDGDHSNRWTATVFLYINWVLAFPVWWYVSSHRGTHLWWGGIRRRGVQCLTRRGWKKFSHVCHDAIEGEADFGEYKYCEGEAYCRGPRNRLEQHSHHMSSHCHIFSNGSEYYDDMLNSSPSIAMAKQHNIREGKHMPN